MILVLLLALVIGQISSLKEEDFLKTFHVKCFSEDRLWNPENAVSIENFIYLVEKLERKVDMKTEDLVRELLQQYSCNRLEYDARKEWHRDGTGAMFEGIVRQFLGNDRSSAKFPLTDEEECQIFFMLSPAMQHIRSSGYEKDAFYEYGVVSLNGDEQRAIDLSKVLYGILAGFLDGKTKKVKEFLNGDDSTKYDDEDLDMLYSFTVSEVINTAVEAGKNFDIENWHKGIWSSTVCTKEYIHENKISWPTTAEIVGAVDGFTLGFKIKHMGNRNAKLSQILRMYYSKEGFKETSTDQSVVSYCTRLSNLDFAQLEKQTINYMVVYRKKSVKPVVEVQEKNIQEAVGQFRSTKILQETEDEKKACPVTETQIEGNKDTCETPSNVFSYLDKRNCNITRQKSILGGLINGLNIGLDEDTITIYINDDVENLRLIVNASDSKAHSACTLEEYNTEGNQNSASDVKVLTDIKNALSVYEENQKTLLAVPAKVVVIFNCGKLNEEEERNLDRAARELRRRHPYATVIPIGSDVDYLEKYFANSQPKNILQLQDENLTPDLKRRICEAPAVLQYTNCNTKSSFQETEYKGYISEWRVHHWAMYPKHFLKTFRYKFQFKANYGLIRVCFSRKEPITDSSSKNCKVAGEGQDTIEFSYRDPCKGKTVHNCDPIYFSIFGRGATTEPSICKKEFEGKDIGCKRVDQIEYTIRHEGISCNSAKQLISSPLFQTLLSLLITFYVLAWKK